MHYAKSKNMRKIIRIIWITISIFIFIILWGNEYLLPVVASFSYIFIIGEYVLERRNLRTGKYFAYTKEYKTIFPRILWPISGVLIILWGLLIKEGGISFRGVESKVFIGVFFLISGLFHLLSPKTILLLTDKSIIFEGAIGTEEWTYKKLDKIILRENEILLMKGNETESFLIEKTDRDVINNIFSFLLPKLENRIVKE